VELLCAARYAETRVESKRQSREHTHISNICESITTMHTEAVM